MPSPAEYENKDEWMKVCIPRLIKEGKESDQASAICYSMWERKDKPKQNTQAVLFSNSVRSVTHDGREYLIVPGVPAREQVMNTYLVPGDEIARTIQGWNGTPITIQHPKLNGGSARVPAPDVAVIGRFYNAGWDKQNRRMVGEYWIDVNEAMRYVEGQKIVESIRNGQVLETSTGYWADDEMTGGEFDGRQYQTIHRNLLPDHIAILTTVAGACSVRDGCGVNRNVKHNCADDHECDCPFKIKRNNPEYPPYENGHLPTEMLVHYCFNKGNRTPEQIDGLREHIKKNGIDKPVIVVRMDDETIKILDGNHRVSLAHELGIKQIPVMTFNESLLPVDPEIIYKLWLHEQDQGYLKSNRFEGHRGRPGLVGGSVPRSAGTGPTPKKLEEYPPEVQEVMRKMIEKLESGEWKPKTLSDDVTPAGYGPDDGDSVGGWIEGFNRSGAGTIEIRDEWGDVESATTVPADLKTETSVMKWLQEHGIENPAGMEHVYKGGQYVLTYRRPKQNVGHSRLTANLAALIKSKKESPMNLQALQEELEGKGIILNAEVVGDGVEFTLNTSPAAAGSPDVPSLSTNELKVLKALVKNEQALKVIDRLPEVLEFAQNAEAQVKAERDQVIAEIKQNGSVFSDAELDRMDLPMLQKLNGMTNVNYAGVGGGTTNYASSEVLAVPTVLTNWKKQKED